MRFFFFLTYCDWLFLIVGYALILNDYLWCTYSLVLNFILKIYIYFYFFILIKFDKQVDLTDLFNKWFMLGLRNSNPFNKHVRLNGWCTIYPSKWHLSSCCDFFFFWTYCDWLFVIVGYSLILNDYLWCIYSLVLNFILNIFILFYYYFYFDKIW